MGAAARASPGALRRSSSGDARRAGTGVQAEEEEEVLLWVAPVFRPRRQRERKQEQGKMEDARAAVAQEERTGS